MHIEYRDISKEELIIQLEEKTLEETRGRPRARSAPEQAGNHSTLTFNDPLSSKDPILGQSNFNSLVTNHGTANAEKDTTTTDRQTDR